MPQEQNEYPVVYLPEPGVFGIILEDHAYFCLVKYYDRGTVYEVYIDKSELE
jgi:hypothetical protein